MAFINCICTENKFLNLQSSITQCLQECHWDIVFWNNEYVVHVFSINCLIRDAIQEKKTETIKETRKPSILLVLADEQRQTSFNFVWLSALN